MRTDGDYISRADAIEAMYKDAEAHPDHTFWTTQHEALRNIPAADVRPVRRGKWIEHNYDPEYLSCDFSCSECNVYLEEYYFGEGQWPGKTDHYFCPNCGADMREES